MKDFSYVSIPVHEITHNTSKSFILKIWYLTGCVDVKMLRVIKMNVVIVILNPCVLFIAPCKGKAN